MTFLDRIKDQRWRAMDLEAIRTGDSWRTTSLADGPDGRPFSEMLSATDGISVIAEYKRKSPSHGTFDVDGQLEQIVGAYERGGAAALSILTEGTEFGGSYDDLETARRASSLPILCKDFIVHPFQLHLAVAGGADAVLLIAAILDLPDQLAGFYLDARERGLDVVVEVRDERQLESALEVGADVIGINNRDLNEPQEGVDLERTRQLMSEVPAGKTVVAESGFSKPEELEELERAGVDGVLVGASLLGEPDRELATRLLTGSTRDPVDR